MNGCNALITGREHGTISIPDEHLKETEIVRFENQAALSAQKLGVSQSDIFYRTHKSLKLGSTVGMLTIKGRTIEILPKIEGELGEVRKTLIRMLAVAYDLQIADQELAHMNFQRYDLLELLIRLFSEQLHSAVRKGMPRRYKSQQYEISVLRGKLDINRQFTRFAGRADQLCCIWDELTENTALNRVLKAAILLLLGICKVAHNRRLLMTLLETYDAVVESKNPLSERVTLDRTNVEFHNLYKLARFFLECRFQSSTTGQGVGFALLFTMHQLFENYIGKCLKRALDSSRFEVKLQSSTHHAVRNADEKKLFAMRPDVVIESRDGEAPILMDTKWKKLKPTDEKKGISQSDIYQVLTYAHAYDASRAILLYPWHEGLSTDDANYEWVASGPRNPPLRLDIATIDISQHDDVVPNLAKLIFSNMKLG